MNWTEEQDQFLRENRGKLSSSQIADHVGKTRNAVIGRAHRLRLENLRETPNGWHEVNELKRVKARIARPKPTPKLVVVAPPPPIADAAIPLEQRKTLMELGPHDCRWPVGDPQEPGFFFCGAVQRGGSSYCSAHHRVAYNRVREPFDARPIKLVVTAHDQETRAA
jgi:GcrA cell cycle regulator